MRLSAGSASSAFVARRRELRDDRDVALALRLAALVERHDRHRADRGERDGQPGEREPDAAAPRRPLGVRRASLASRNSRSSSFSVGSWVVAPFERLGRAGCRGTARRRRGRAAATPRARGGEAAMDPQALAVLLDPAAQPRPLAQQRLVRDLDGAGADGQQPAVGEQRETRATSSLCSVSSSASGTRRRSTAPPAPSTPAA